MNVERCICCGEVVPEGRLTCPKCEAEAAKAERKNEHEQYFRKNQQF